MNAKVPALLEIPYQVREFNFVSSENLRETDGLMCNTSCAIWNPAIIEYRNRIYVAARESSRQQCGGVLGTFMSLYKYFNTPAISSILLGRVSLSDLTDCGPDCSLPVTVPIETRIKDTRPFEPLAFHQGTEDPRFFIKEGELNLLFPIEVWGAPQLFSVRINENLAQARDFTWLREQFDNRPAQKNWLPIPDTTLMIYHIRPLQIVSIDFDTGTVDSIYKEVNIDCNTDFFCKLKGSALVQLSEEDKQLFQTSPDIMKVYLGLAHSSETVTQREGDWEEFKKYYNYAFILTLSNEGSYTVTAISKPFALPKKQNSKEADRINYISSVLVTKKKVLISFGNMDCTSHLIAFEKDDFFSILFDGNNKKY